MGAVWGSDARQPGMFFGQDDWSGLSPERHQGRPDDLSLGQRLTAMWMKSSCLQNKRALPGLVGVFQSPKTPTRQDRLQRTGGDQVATAWPTCSQSVMLSLAGQVRNGYALCGAKFVNGNSPLAVFHLSSLLAGVPVKWCRLCLLLSR